MKRVPLRRRTPLKGASALKRTPIKQQSAKRNAERDDRGNVRRLVQRRDRACVANWFGECMGVLDVHEVVARSVWNEAHLDPDACVLLCRTHHDWITEHSALGQVYGLVVPRSAFALHGRDAVLGEAERLRAAPGQPFWAEPGICALAAAQLRRRLG